MKHKATISVILAGVLWGVISLFIRKLSAAGLSAQEISLVRMLVSAAVFPAAVALTAPQKLRVAWRDLWMFVGTGIVSIVLFNTCYFRTIVRSQASVAVVLLYTSPVFVMLLSAVLFREKITSRKLLALAMTLAGCVLVAGLAGGGYRLSADVLLTGLASGLFYALYTIFGRYALAKYDTLTVTAYTFLFGLAGAAALGGLPRITAILAQDWSLLPWYLGIGIVCTVLPYVLYTWGLQRMESGRAAILVAVEPLVGTLLGLLVYHESAGPAKLLGIGLILSAMVLLNLPRRGREP